MALYVRFGATGTRQFPARDDRPAGSVTTQRGWIMEPGKNGDPDTSVPFEVTLRDGTEPYKPGLRYGLTAAHLSVNRYGRVEFNPYAPFELEDAAASGPVPLSVQASAKVA